MHKNTTVSDLNVESFKENNDWKNQLRAKIGIGIVEFLVPSVLFCYGIILAEYVLLGKQNHQDVLWTTLVFICSWSFTDPIARLVTEYFEDRKYIFCRYLIGISTIFLFVGILIPNSITLYALFGGICSNMISNQLNVIAIEKLNIDHKLYEASKQICKGLSLFFMPHVIFYLTLNYDVNQAKLIFAAILLNIIPASLLIKCDDKIIQNNDVPDMTRYHTFGRYAHQMTELQNFATINDQNNDLISSSSSESVTRDNETNKHSDQSASDADIVNPMFEENFVSDVDAPAPLNHGNVVTYFFNAGVSILPGIPEENEEDQENINKIDSKRLRLSKISIKLEELVSQDTRRGSLAEKVYKFNEILVEQPDRINNIEFIPNFTQEKSKSFIEELKYFNHSRNCFACTPYRKYVWNRRYRSFKDFLMDNFVKPSYYAFKTLYFYPALTSKLVTTLIPSLYITLAPFMALERHWKQNKFFTTENVTFLLTYVAFAWCFFLLSLPLVSKLSNTRVKMLYIFGLGVSGTSLLTLAGKLTNDVITISSLLFGVGHGIVSYTEKIVYRMSLGIREWHLVKGPLEVFSAIAIIIIYYVIYLYRLDLHTLLFLAGLSYYMNAALWCVCPFLKYLIGRVRRIFCFENSQQDEFL